MGARGPVGKRSDKRHGHRSAAENAATKAEGAASVVRPEPDADWHPVALRWYESLSESGQSQFYEPSDWATAYLMAESISRDLKPQFVGFAQTGRDTTEAEFATIPLKGASLAAYLKAMSDLLATEGARRRASIELQRPSPERSDDSGSNVVDWNAYVSAGA